MVVTGDVACIVHDLGGYDSLNVTRIQFYCPKVTPPTNFQGDSATVTPTAGAVTTAISVESRHNRSAYSPEWKIAARYTDGTINKGPKTLSCGTRDTTSPVTPTTVSSYSDNRPP